MEKPPARNESSTEQPPHDASGAADADAALIADPRALQILSTEHWSLLSSRSLAYNESFARASMYLAFLSMSFVGLALLAQVTGFGAAFLGIAALVLGFDFLVGVLTLMRMVFAAMEDAGATRGMNRIRNAYVRLAPSVERFFVTGTTDDVEGLLKTATLGQQTELAGFAHAISTSGSMIGLVTALVGGSLAVTLALMAGVAVSFALVVGAAATVTMMLLTTAWGLAYVRRQQETFESRFPASTPGAGDAGKR